VSNHEAERTTGIWAPLSNARLFSLRRRLVDGRNATRYLVENHIRPEAGEAMLDLGCGLCGILEHLPPLRYVGIDWQSNYLNRAKALYGDRGTFLCRDITKLGDEFAGQFDIVTARRFLHHLDDDAVVALSRRSREMLKSGGRFVTIDPVRLEK